MTNILWVMFAAITVWILYKIDALSKRIGRLEQRVNGARMLERIHHVEAHIAATDMK